jgi:hypothetical protein
MGFGTLVVSPGLLGEKRMVRMIGMLVCDVIDQLSSETIKASLLPPAAPVAGNKHAWLEKGFYTSNSSRINMEISWLECTGF